MLIPLKKYIQNWLNTYTVTDIFTGETQTAKQIFNWEKSYFLKLLIQDNYYIDTDIDFATQDKNYIKVIKKPLSQITPKKIKKYRIVGKQTVIDRYITETVIDYVPIETIKYRMVPDYDNPKYDTIIKRRKIGKKYYITTEYVFTGKYGKKRQYYTELSYDRVKRTKTRPIYKTVNIIEPYWEQVRERKPEDTKTIITQHRSYEPFFVWEYYKTFGDGHIHYLFISPLFQGRGNAVTFSADTEETVDSERKGIFISPQEFVKQDNYIKMLKRARFLILNGKTNLKKPLFREANTKIDKGEGLHTLYLDGTYNQSLDVLKLLFFRPAPFKNNTRKITI